MGPLPIELNDQEKKLLTLRRVDRSVRVASGENCRGASKNVFLQQAGMDGRTADTSGGTCCQLPVLWTKIVYEGDNPDVIL